MNGCFRLLIGFLLVFASVGGMETGVDSHLLIQLVLAVIGLVVMDSGVKCFIKKINE